MGTVSIWIQPAVLLTAFIYFWRKASEIRRETKEDVLAIGSRILDRIDEKFKMVEERFNAVDKRSDVVDRGFETGKVRFKTGSASVS